MGELGEEGGRRGKGRRVTWAGGRRARAADEGGTHRCVSSTAAKVSTAVATVCTSQTSRSEPYGTRRAAKAMLRNIAHVLSEA